MKKLLVVIGGMRVGDTFHLIPFFDLHKEDEITWIGGFYEREAAQFIKSMYSNIKDLYIIDDQFPGSLVDRDNFSKMDKSKYPSQVIELLQSDYFDEIITDHTVSFDMKLAGYQLKDNYFGLNQDSKDYICVHLDTVSDWKRHEQIRDLKLDGQKIYSLGLPNDFILPGSIDYRGASLVSVAKLISNCKLFVGIHSALTCLTMYLNKPAIVIHPMENLMFFSNYRKNMVDLVKPTTLQLEQKIKDELNKRISNS